VAGVINDIGLDGADARRRDRGERIAFAKQVLAFGEWADVFDQHMQIAECGLVVAVRKAP
jgi:hypothetical protein